MAKISKNNKKLVVAKETLRQLGNQELVMVKGGEGIDTRTSTGSAYVCCAKADK